MSQLQSSKFTSLDHPKRLEEIEFKISEQISCIRHSTNEIWRMLYEIFSRKLWKRNHEGSFQDYLMTRWGYGKTQAYEYARLVRLAHYLLIQCATDLPEFGEAKALVALPKDQQLIAWLNFHRSAIPIPEAREIHRKEPKPGLNMIENFGGIDLDPDIKVEIDYYVELFITDLNLDASRRNELRETLSNMVYQDSTSSSQYLSLGLPSVLE